MASGSSSQASEDTISDIGTDVDTPRRVGTPRGVRRERDLPPPGQREKYNEQVRSLENQVCFIEALHMLVNTQEDATCIDIMSFFHMLTWARSFIMFFDVCLAQMIFLVEVGVFYLCSSSFNFDLSHLELKCLGVVSDFIV